MTLPTTCGSLVIAPAAELIERLRGGRGVRPMVDPNLAGGVRAWLEDGLHERFGAQWRGTLRLSSSDVAPAAGASGALPVLRGALVAQLVALHVAGVTIDGAFHVAIEAMRSSGQEDQRLGELARLDEDDLAKLRVEVAAHDQVLRSSLHELPTRWSPRCGVRLGLALAGGRVHCTGRVDLALGARGGSHASTCLVDVTTSPLDVRHETLCRYLALLETLRTGEQPLRVAVLSTAEASCLVEDVDAGLLADAVTDVLDVLEAQVAA